MLHKHYVSGSNPLAAIISKVSHICVVAHVAALFLSLGVFLSLTPPSFAERSEEEILRFSQKLAEEKAVFEAGLKARSRDPQQLELEASKQRQRQAYAKMIQESAGAADQSGLLSDYQNFLKKERLDAAKKQKKINDEIQALGREFKKRKNAAFETMLKQSTGADPAVQARLLQEYHRFLKREDLEFQEKQKKIKGSAARRALTKEEQRKERARFAKAQSEKLTAFF